MTHAEQQNPSTRDVSGGTRRACGLVFWCAVLVLHAAAIPALIGSVGSGADLEATIWMIVRLVGLLISAIFFVLKIVDVPWLRLKPGWRSAATAVIICGLLHVGVVERAMEGESPLSPAAHPGVVLFVAAAWRIDAVCHGLRRLLPTLASARLTRRRRRESDPCRTRSWESALRPALLFFVPSFAGPRAPPVSA